MAKDETLQPGAMSTMQSWGARWTLLRIFLLVGLPVVWALAIILSLARRKLFLFLTREDGVVEVLQIVVLLATALVASAIAGRLFRTNEKRWALIYAGVTLGLIVIAGEEMSWGQRVLGIETSGFFGRYNKQGETNLHNLKLVMPLAPHVTTFILIVLIVLSLRSRGSRGESRLQGNARLWMPSALLLPAWLCYASYRSFRTVRSIADIRSTLVLSRLEEPAELIFYTGLLAFAVVVRSRLAQQRQPDRRPLIGVASAADQQDP